MQQARLEKRKKDVGTAICKSIVVPVVLFLPCLVILGGIPSLNASLCFCLWLNCVRRSIHKLQVQTIFDLKMRTWSYMSMKTKGILTVMSNALTKLCTATNFERII